MSFYKSKDNKDNNMIVHNLDYINIENNNDIVFGLQKLPFTTDKPQFTFDFVYNIYNNNNSLVNHLIKYINENNTTYLSEYTQLYNKCISNTTMNDKHDHNNIWLVKHEHIFVDIHDKTNIITLIKKMYKELLNAIHLDKWIFLRNEEYNLLIKLEPYFILFNGYHNYTVIIDINSVIRYMFSIDIYKITNNIENLIYEIKNNDNILVNKYCYDIVFLSINQEKWTNILQLNSNKINYKFWKKFT